MFFLLRLNCFLFFYWLNGWGFDFFLVLKIIRKVKLLFRCLLIVIYHLILLLSKSNLFLKSWFYVMLLNSIVQPLIFNNFLRLNIILYHFILNMVNILENGRSIFLCLFLMSYVCLWRNLLKYFLRDWSFRFFLLKVVNWYLRWTPSDLLLVERMVIFFNFNSFLFFKLLFVIIVNVFGTSFF